MIVATDPRSTLSCIPAIARRTPMSYITKQPAPLHFVTSYQPPQRNVVNNALHMAVQEIASITQPEDDFDHTHVEEFNIYKFHLRMAGHPSTTEPICHTNDIIQSILYSSE